MTLKLNFESNIIDEDTRVMAWIMFEHSGGKSSHQLGLMGNVKLPKWLFSCITIDTSTGFIDFKSNDIIVVKNKYIENARNPTNLPIRLTKHIRLGDVNPGGRDFLSSIGNLNIFSGDTNFGLLNCSSVGDYLSWSDMTWDMVSGLSVDQYIVQMDKDDVCGKNNKVNIIVDEPVTFGNVL